MSSNSKQVRDAVRDLDIKYSAKTRLNEELDEWDDFEKQLADHLIDYDESDESDKSDSQDKPKVEVKKEPKSVPPSPSTPRSTSDVTERSESSNESDDEETWKRKSKPSEDEAPKSSPQFSERQLKAMEKAIALNPEKYSEKVKLEVRKLRVERNLKEEENEREKPKKDGGGLPPLSDISSDGEIDIGFPPKHMAYGPRPPMHRPFGPRGFPPMMQRPPFFHGPPMPGPAGTPNRFFYQQPKRHQIGNVPILHTNVPKPPTNTAMKRVYSSSASDSSHSSDSSRSSRSSSPRRKKSKSKSRKKSKSSKRNRSRSSRRSTSSSSRRRSSSSSDSENVDDVQKEVERVARRLRQLKEKMKKKESSSTSSTKHKRRHSPSSSNGRDRREKSDNAKPTTSRKANINSGDLQQISERIKSLEKDDLSSLKNKSDSETLLKINERLRILQEEEKLLKLGKLGRYAELRKNKNLVPATDELTASSSNAQGTQVSGRRTNQLTYIQKIVMPVLWKHSCAWPFHVPTTGIPNYSQVVKSPMDMSLIKNKLEKTLYYSAIDCLKDFQLMFTNCFTYYKPTDNIAKMGQTLQTVFTSAIDRMPQDEVEEPQKPAKKQKVKKVIAVPAAPQSTYPHQAWVSKSPPRPPQGVPPPSFPATAVTPSQFHISQPPPQATNTAAPGPIAEQNEPHRPITLNPQLYLSKCTYAGSADYMTTPSFSAQLKEKKFGCKVINDVPIRVKKLNPELMSAQKRESFLSFAETIVRMTRKKINYCYPFHHFDKARMAFHCNQVYIEWKFRNAEPVKSLFDRDDVVSVIYELMENVEFRNKALCGNNQVEVDDHINLMKSFNYVWSERSFVMFKIYQKQAFILFDQHLNTSRQHFTLNKDEEELILWNLELMFPQFIGDHNQVLEQWVWRNKALQTLKFWANGPFVPPVIPLPVFNDNSHPIEILTKVENWLNEVYEASPICTPTDDDRNILLTLQLLTKKVEVRELVVEWWTKGFFNLHYS